MALIDEPERKIDMARYLPTPKIAAALWVGMLAVAAVLAADWLDLADVRPAAAGLIVLVLSSAGGWFKTDVSSPAGLDDGHSDEHG